MKILVFGGTRFFGIPMIKRLLQNGHDVTIATRGLTKDPFGKQIQRIIADRQNQDDLKRIFENHHYDVVIDKIAYSSNDIKRLLDVISCNHYVLMSSTAVKEYKDDFDPYHDNFKYVNRHDDIYRVTKRYAECALLQDYAHIPSTIVRYPFVIGMDDYTKRLPFYIEHILNNIPMFIDNLNTPLHFITSDEAGYYMAELVEDHAIGIFEGACYETITHQELLQKIESMTQKKAILDNLGDPAPYNDTPSFDINISSHYPFNKLSDFFDDLLLNLTIHRKADQYFINKKNYFRLAYFELNTPWIFETIYENEAIFDTLLKKINRDHSVHLFKLLKEAPQVDMLLQRHYKIVGEYESEGDAYYILQPQHIK